MKTHMIRHAIEHLKSDWEMQEARKELRMLEEDIAEQAVMIKALGGDAPKPDYSKLCDFTKAMLLESCNKPGEVNAVHDDQMDALRYNMVDHPKHYNKGRYEVIDIIESILESMELTPVEAMLTAQVVKYIARWKNKNGVEDLKKAEWYLKRLIK